MAGTKVKRKFKKPLKRKKGPIERAIAKIPGVQRLKKKVRGSVRARKIRARK